MMDLLAATARLALRKEKTGRNLLGMAQRTLLLPKCPLMTALETAGVIDTFDEASPLEGRRVLAVAACEQIEPEARGPVRRHAEEVTEERMRKGMIRWAKVAQTFAGTGLKIQLAVEEPQREVCRGHRRAARRLVKFSG